MNTLLLTTLLAATAAGADAPPPTTTPATRPAEAKPPAPKETDAADKCPDEWPLGMLPPKPFAVEVGIAPGGVLVREGASFVGAGPVVSGRFFRAPLIVLGGLSGMAGAAINSLNRTETAAGTFGAWAMGGVGLEQVTAGGYRRKVGTLACKETERRRFFVGAVAGLRLTWMGFRGPGNDRGVSLGPEAGGLVEYAGARSLVRVGALVTGGWARLLRPVYSLGRERIESGGMRLRLWFGFSHLLLFSEASYFARTVTFMGGVGAILGPVP